MTQKTDLSVAVAHAIYKAMYEPLGEYYPSEFEQYKHNYVCLAKAALTALCDAPLDERALQHALEIAHLSNNNLEAAIRAYLQQLKDGCK